MATAIRTIGHEERLSIVDHLEELRTRLIVSAVAFAIVFGVCFWQNHALLSFVNRPLHKQTEQQVLRGEGPRGADLARPEGSARSRQRHTESMARALSAPPAACRPPPGRSSRGAIPKLGADVAKIPRSPSGHRPDDAWPGRTAHRDAHRRALFLARARAAADPVRALRLRAAGVQPERETRGDAAADLRAVSVRGGGRLRLLGRAPHRRALPAELQQPASST